MSKGTTKAKDQSTSNGVHPDSVTVILAPATKKDRLDIIKNEVKSEKAKIAAAIEIQRLWRGYWVRNSIEYQLKKDPMSSTTAVYGESKIEQDRCHELDEFEEDIIDKENDDFEDSDDSNELENNLGLLNKNGKEVLTYSTYQAAIQKQGEQDNKEPMTSKAAAVVIQRAWRRHIDTQVYRYYRDLINFRSRGDPMLMLRCINPNEAKLLDSAAGIHIRFRLAGQRFPPNIYYKIYTHRPVVDMCANSPKDYTAPAAKKTTAKDTHNKNRQVADPNCKDGWYKRIENNGWRLVSDRLISHIMSDSVTWETSRKKFEFHHNKLQRKQDIERKRKEKKINWMKKMYNEGVLKAKSTDTETVKLIEGAAAGMVATVEALGPEALEEWEVDELLDWTTSLNFDDYLGTWKDIATSASSEKPVLDRLQVTTESIDPYEMTLSTGPSRFQSTRQSHNTPVSSGGAQKQSADIHINKQLLFNSA